MNIAKIMLPKSMLAFVHEDDSVRQGYETISRHGYTAVPVLDDQDRYIGSVTEGDFLRCFQAAGTTDVRELEKRRIKDIIRMDFCPAISIDADDSTVIYAALEQNFVPVVDDRGALCGIVTRRRLIAYFTGRDVD